jgi:CubicO group peptidase (beta-lactamase class C family)
MQPVHPEEVGFSSARLQRITRVIQAAIDRGEIAGAVTLIARHGKVAHCEALGLFDVASGTPMRRDTMFRIYSMTKPITAVATLLLYEEGHFLLDDPIARFLPEFAETKVFARETAAGFEVADLERPITIRHLLLHTSGLLYGDAAGSPVEKLYAQARIDRQDEPLDEKVRRIAQLPLAHQPGSSWTYGLSTDVLGRLVEVVSGQPFDSFLKERIFDPLAMGDTGFSVPSVHHGRLATVYTPGDQGGLRPDTRPELAYAEPPRYFSGGGGLVSTAADYARFCQILLNGGALDGVRVLGRATVALMLADHLPGRWHPFPEGHPLLPAGWSMALGGATVVDGALTSLPWSKGSYSWAGAASTSFWIDRAEGLLGVFMVQIIPMSLRLADLFTVLTYQALTE